MYHKIFILRSQVESGNINVDKVKTLLGSIFEQADATGDICDWTRNSWVQHISLLKVTKIGEAGAEYDKSKVILSSFHAG